MQSKSKKTISIAIISIFIFSIFFALVPLAPALPDQTLTLNPTSGPSGTIVTITGSGFATASYRVWFDRDGDSRYDYGETYKTVTGPTFTTTLTIPSVASGLYFIRADRYPYTSPEASAEFTVITVWEKLLGVTDHALFDTTYPGEIGAKCKSDKTFDFHIVVRAFGGPATIRITFADDSYIDFPLAENGILSFTQAAGGTAGVDDELIVTVIEGDAIGWISIRTEKGATPQYDYDEDGINDSFCMTVTVYV